MARLPRLVVPGQAHYLILRALGDLGGRGVCADNQDRDELIAALREAAATEQVQVHAYAILPTELQLLLTPAAEAALGRLVQALGRRYVSAYNRRHGRRGTLWDGRFRCAVVEPGSPRLQVLQLIDGQTAEPGRSSASHRSGGAREALLVDPPEIWQLGNTPFEREAAYRLSLEQGLPPPLAADLRRSALGGWAIGSVGFAAAVSAEGARPARPRAKGRPRRTSV